MEFQDGFWRNRRVLVSGHTGFKGGWLALWLARLGARVTGLALPPLTTPALFHLAAIAELIDSSYCDIRDLPALIEHFQRTQPEVVFHLAAQPLVRASYRDPVDTWSSNVMGTAHLLESVRSTPSVKAVVVITTDKCYENREWVWGYRENDALGGHDPYSASKAAAELLTASYRRSFFSSDGPLVATARAGNVIGGGDWSEDRLIPDAARAMATASTLVMRNPQATRPWQHVLEPLHGYLLLARQLLAGDSTAADAFNFGPAPEANRPVTEVLQALKTHWPQLTIDQPPPKLGPHEAAMLYLDSAKAHHVLGWRPVWTLAKSIALTAEWYAQVTTEPCRARALCEQQIEEFQEDVGR